MKILIAQINTTPRDFDGNVHQIKEGIVKGVHEGVDLIVFPELSIPGYLSKDLVYDDQFIEQNLASLYDIVEFTRTFEIPGNSPPHIVLGYIDRNRKGAGKPVRNMAAVIRDGVIEATYQKQLLPFYDVFDEGRYFEPGTELTCVTIKGKKWGICICEDVWNDKNQDDYNYENNPLARYRRLGINNIISINSSPFVEGKPAQRRRMLQGIFEDGIGIYVNQIGGQDELVFDGHSIVVDNGTVVFQADTSINNDFHIFETKESGNYGVIWNRKNFENADTISTLYKMLVMGLRDYVIKSGFTDVVIGSSGGIDSAIVAALACQAFGPEHVHCIRMPGPYSSEGSLKDAELLHRNLGCWDYLIPISINDDIDVFSKGVAHSMNREPDVTKNLVFKLLKADKCNPVADENLQARKRGEIVMRFANKFGVLPLTTGNKSELAVGYCTLYGDACGGFAPINDIYKTRVYQLAVEINKFYREVSRSPKDLIPQSIITKAPSAELAPNQTDEASLLPYPILDTILPAYIDHYIGDFEEFVAVFSGDKPKVLIDNIYQKQIIAWSQSASAKQDYERIICLVDQNEFKRRQLAPGLKISSVAFGSGRRLPIVKGHRKIEI